MDRINAREHAPRSLSASHPLFGHLVANLKRSLALFALWDEDDPCRVPPETWSAQLDLFLLAEEFTRKTFAWTGCPMSPAYCGRDWLVLCLACQRLQEGRVGEDNEIPIGAQASMFRGINH